MIILQNKAILYLSLALSLFFLISCNSINKDEIELNDSEFYVEVKVDRSIEIMTSNFSIGLSHVDNSINPEWGGNSEAIERMMQYLDDGKMYFQNIHLMGWGVDNPNPNPGIYNWETMDMHINSVQENPNAQVIITLCTAPGWMKTSGADWNMDDKVSKDHYQDFADLCALVGSRYKDVKYFQIWNELKGWWISDIEEFTEFYNVVYRTLREVRPDAIIGGPYMNGLDELKTGGKLSQTGHYAFDYFLKNMEGSDFINFDGWLSGWPPEDCTLSDSALMQNSVCFGNMVNDLRKKTDLPIWISEFYGAQAENSSNFDYLTTNHASAYYHALINGTSLILHWDPFGFVEFFTKPDSRDGAQPTRHYNIAAIFNLHFGAGTVLYQTYCSDSLNIEVLASKYKTLIINKYNKEVLLRLDGNDLILDPYAVKLMDVDGNVLN